MASEYEDRLQAEENVTNARVDSAVRKALREYQRRAGMGFVILALGLIGAVFIDSQHNEQQRDQIVQQGERQDKAIIRSGDVVAVSSCNRDYHTIDSLRDELERSLLRIESLRADGTYSQHQADVARQATLDILARYKLPDCRKADDILTSKPGKPLAIPVPRYPDDPAQLKSEDQETKKLGQPSNVPQ